MALTTKTIFTIGKAIERLRRDCPTTSRMILKTGTANAMVGFVATTSAIGPTPVCSTKSSKFPMTKMTKTVGLSASLALCATAMALAVPMDMEAARKLPAIRALVEKVKAGSTLTPANEEQLYAQLQSADPVLASLSAWALGETKNANHTT